MTLTILLLALQFSTALAILSVDNVANYNCPTRETIDTAYGGYCPATSAAGGTLNGIDTSVSYDNAPADYQTTYPSFYLYCRYTDTVATSGQIDCAYQGGAGQPLAPYAGNGNSGNCPDLSAAPIPQASPGVNYRRNQLEARARVGQTPTFVCPFNSDNSAYYILYPETATGTFALTSSSANGYPVASGEVFYACSTTTVGCFYSQNGNTLTFLGSNPAGSPGSCPQTLCTALTTGTNNMRRRVFNEKLDIQSRQVDTAALRERLSKKKRSAGVWNLGQY